MEKENKIDRQSLAKLTKHLILASLKLEKLEEKPEFLITRSFPSIMQVAPKPKLLPAPPKIEEKPKEMPEKKPEIFENKIEMFDMGKITKFAMDRLIDAIECPGPNAMVKVKKENYIFLTNVSLTGDEINRVIRKFAEESKTPIAPIFKASARGFMITAIVSPVSGSRFVIVRMP